MGEAIEQRGSELLVAEDLHPLAEGQIGGNDGRPPLVSLRKQIEEQFTAGAPKRVRTSLRESQRIRPRTEMARR